MAEIAEIPLNGKRVVSLFSGCGGSSLGYRMAGYKVVWANEFIPAARETYAANFPDTVIDARDIRDITGADILEATGLALGELDILDGSPPCASFSSAGKRAEHWGKVKRYSDTKQRTDDLFFEYARIVGELKPKRFIAENVSGLVRGVGKGAFLEILAALKAVGYRVQCRLLDAQWLGVPQSRQRIFFVGVRDDLAGDPGFPKPLPYRYSVRDAIPWLDGGLEHPNGWNHHATQPATKPATTIQATRPVAVKIRHGNKAPFEQKGKPIRMDRPMPTVMGGDTLGLAPYQFEIEPDANAQAIRPVAVMTQHGPRPLDRPAPTVHTHGNAHTQSELTLIIEPEADISRYAIGEAAASLTSGEQSSRYFSLVRAPLNGPSPTITAPAGLTSAATVIHPTERRRFSIAELRRICGFPDDFILTGTYAQQWERLGRAVPPPMMAALAGAQR
jgi:DNA (cytosine-5)-methyltransferase 1